MEVVLALALFFLAGTVVYGGLSSSMAAVGRVRLAAQAADLAVTKLAEIQLGELDLLDEGPNAYEEEALAEWTWQIIVTSMDSDVLLDDSQAPPMVQVEIVVAHTSEPVVRRLVQLMPAEETE